MKILLDAFGGDNSPLEVIKGVSTCWEKLKAKGEEDGRG